MKGAGAPAMKNSFLYDSGLFSFLDIRFAAFISGLDKGKNDREIMLSAALLSRNQRMGHICLDLPAMADQYISEKSAKGIRCPKSADWIRILENSPVVGKAGDFRPLILDEKQRLYLHRYWEYEQHLAAEIRKRIPAVREKRDLSGLKEKLEQFFPSRNPEETDWQKVAVFTALTRRFCVISGGPGTGKTTTVARILALLTETGEESPPRIALTAPTGKAAARLQEAILREKERNAFPIRFSGEASTIHRLLGTVPGSADFRHHAGNPLHTDVLIVDEASMVDMALMSKLLQALPRHARLILLGDKDQLASVEAGYVLGDICDTGNVHSFSPSFCQAVREYTGQSLNFAAKGEETEICDCIVHLQKSYRFQDAGGIRQVSREINRGKGAGCLEMLQSGKYPDVSWTELPPSRDLGSRIRGRVKQGFADYMKETGNPPAVFQAFQQFRILCALRRGPYGVEEVNRLCEQILMEEGIIRPEGTWYAGRPVLITRNDYHLQLFNGDVGIALPDRKDGLRVFFPAEKQGFRKFNPLRLPDHETVFAMTVHKSQGSEFDRILLLLPDRDAPVLTRELLYTGISRAAFSADIWGREDVFKTGVSRAIRRTSGLRDALWETSGTEVKG
jgi:exodeoxyribonuclease V alpha subunit